MRLRFEIYFLVLVGSVLGWLVFHICRPETPPPSKPVSAIELREYRVSLGLVPGSGSGHSAIPKVRAP